MDKNTCHVSVLCSVYVLLSHNQEYTMADTDIPSTASTRDTKKGTARKAPAKKAAAKKAVAKKAARKTAVHKNSLTASTRSNATTKKASKSARNAKSRHNGGSHGPIQIVATVMPGARRAAGQVRDVAYAAVDVVGASTKEAARYLRQHPKVAASVAAGIVSIGSAMLAKKLRGKPLSGKAEIAVQRVTDAVRSVLG
jgi:hypothetical protein